MPKHAGGSIAGKNKRKCDQYRQRGRRLTNKLKRILRSNGRAAHDYYAMKARQGESCNHMPRTRGKVPAWQIWANADPAASREAQ